MHTIYIMDCSETADAGYRDSFAESRCGAAGNSTRQFSDNLVRVEPLFSSSIFTFRSLELFYQ